MKKLNELRKNEKGFTLIELIIVIAILAIIAAVAVPNIIGAVDNSRKAADVSNAKIILNAAMQVQAKNSGASYAPADADISEANLVTNSPSNFEQELYNELNGTIPTPKYTGTMFVLDEDGGNLSVTVNGVEVAPNPDSTTYDQN